MTSTERQASGAPAEASGPPAKGEWPLRPRWVKASLVIAVVALVVFVASPLVTLARAAHEPMLWLLPPGWVVFYGSLGATVYGWACICRAHPEGTLFRKGASGFFQIGGMMRPMSPELSERLYRFMPNVALLVFALAGLQMAVVTLLAAALI